VDPFWRAAIEDAQTSGTRCQVALLTANQMARQIAVSSSVLAALLATSGCSVVADAPEDDWRQVKAFAVVDRSELSPDVNRTCIGDGAHGHGRRGPDSRRPGPS